MNTVFQRGRDKSSLTIALEGRLDNVAAPLLEQELAGALDGVKLLTFDFAGLEYITSAGLRVLLETQKTMNVQGGMVVRNANSTVMDVFKATGFTGVLRFE